MLKQARDDGGLNLDQKQARNSLGETLTSLNDFLIETIDRQVVK